MSMVTGSDDIVIGCGGGEEKKRVGLRRTLSTDSRGGNVISQRYSTRHVPFNKRTNKNSRQLENKY